MFPEDQHEIHMKLEEMKRAVRPDMVFVPSLRDTHQDHEVVSRYSTRTFRTGQTLLHYEIARSLEVGFAPNLFVNVSGKAPGEKQGITYADKKIEIIRTAFVSEGAKPFLSEERLRATMSMRGMYASPGVKYAEAFETRIGI